MKHIITFILISFGFLASGQNLSEVRSQFHSVVLNPDDSRDFHNYLKDYESSDPTIRAYQAVSEALLAQVVWNPFNKLKQVIKYDQQMGEAVNSDPKNIEIRFLRLAIEYNLPSFLGMSTHIQDDTQVIIQNMSSMSSMQLDQAYSKYIFHFLSTSELCTDEEIHLMQRRLAMSQ